jgi:hypothetical protein
VNLVEKSDEGAKRAHGRAEDWISSRPWRWLVVVVFSWICTQSSNKRLAEFELATWNRAASHLMTCERRARAEFVPTFACLKPIAV